MDIQSAGIGAGTPLPPSSLRALAAADAPAGDVPLFQAVSDTIDLARTAGSESTLTQSLTQGSAAIERAMNDFAADIQSAVDDIAWLLGALGMKTEDLPDATARVGAGIRGRLHELAGDRAIVVESTTSLRMEMSEVSITVADGSRVTEVNMRSVSIVATTTTSIRVPATEERPKKAIDPLVLDLSGDGIDLTRPEDGKRIDLDGDGKTEQSAWVRGDDALLAMDRDGDGKITSGLELFGEANGGVDGFAELAALDENKDGIIDAQDSGFTSLLLLREGDRLDRLADHGITRIRLDLIRPISQQAGEGGRLVAASLFERADGSAGRIADGLFDVTV